MRIEVEVTERSPLRGTASGFRSIDFEGWLALLRALAELTEDETMEVAKDASAD